MRAIVEPFLADPRVPLVKPANNMGGARQRDQRDARATARTTSRSCTTTTAGAEVPRAPRSRSSRRTPRVQTSCFSDCDFIDGDGAVLYRIAAKLHRAAAGAPRSSLRFPADQLRRIPTCSRRRSAYVRVGAASNDKVLFLRLDMWLRHRRRYDISFSTGCDAGYRVHASQTTNRERLRIGSAACRCSSHRRLRAASFSRLSRRRARSGRLSCNRRSTRFLSVGRAARGRSRSSAAPCAVSGGSDQPRRMRCSSIGSRRYAAPPAPRPSIERPRWTCPRHGDGCRSRSRARPRSASGSPSSRWKNGPR